MLYKKSHGDKIDKALFENPSSEYRAAPFWAWNDDLEEDELLRQIEEFKEMGYGGFHMHVRCGLNTPYLSEDFFRLIRKCTDKAKKEKMLAWLYDEDRWPSGFGGGLVTKNPLYRKKFIIFTGSEIKEIKTQSKYITDGYGSVYDAPVSRETLEEGEDYLLAVFDVLLEDGMLKEYAPIKPEDRAKGVKFFVYACSEKKSGRYNNQTYVDIINPEAVKTFIQVTYNAYYNAIGEEFGKNIPAIFTDEPQYARCGTKKFAEDINEVQTCWTTDLPNTFYREYGINLVFRLPELFFDLPCGKPNTLRYYYYDHICQRFYEAWSKQIGEWCDEHGIYLTGHVNYEPKLQTQTICVGEAMRHYRKFGIPGIDMLCDFTELTTAKQCQSVVHQFGKEGMLTELYGVTGWDFDFIRHKRQGDWQACLGATVRVPHLSWYSMRGSSKRDYPASLHYQSAWYKEYKLIENHFARVNVALTRGKPIVDVAVIHPIESYWLNYGPESTSGEIRVQLEKSFQESLRWLIGGLIDVDYISESQVNDTYKGCKNGSLNYGVMQYKAVVVPEVSTLRSGTVKMLNEFIADGGKVIFLSSAPRFVDGKESEEGIKLYSRATKCECNKYSLIKELEFTRFLSVRSEKGKFTDYYMYNRRKDGDEQWVFICPFEKRVFEGYDGKTDANSLIPDELVIKFKGEYLPTLYDTLSGKTEKVSYTVFNGETTVYYTAYENDSMLFNLKPITEKDEKRYTVSGFDFSEPDRTLIFKDAVDYSLSEPNVLVLDTAEYSLDGKDWEAKDEILKIDLALRERFGYPLANGRDVQPWVIGKETEFKYPYLKFTFDSDIATKCSLAFEDTKEIVFNGEKVDLKIDGYFTDRHIYTAKLPDVKKGKNELIISTAFSKRKSLENFFLLGDFGVEVKGSSAKIIEKQKRLYFGSVVNQGLPFYGANVTYNMEFESEDCDAYIDIGYMKGVLASVSIDGEEKGKIAFMPKALLVKGIKKGKHSLAITLFTSRVNCFSSLHNIADPIYKGPPYWYCPENEWAYEYQLKGNGILRSPIIRLYNKRK